MESVDRPTGKESPAPRPLLMSAAASAAKLAANKGAGLADRTLLSVSVGFGSRSFRTAVLLTPREKAGRVAAFSLQFLRGRPPNREKMPVLFLLVSFYFSFNAFVQFSPVFNEKKFYFASESQLHLIKEAIQCLILPVVSTRLSHEGVSALSARPVILSPAQLIQLSIQCF